MKKSLCMLMLSALCITQASATIHTVTVATDNGAGSLRALVAAAAAGDTIVFDESTDGNTLMLVSEISINQNITIIGNGITATVLDGGSDSRILNISAGTVNLKDLAFWNGHADADGGGAIACMSTGTLNADHCYFMLNAAPTTGGGAIFCSSPNNLTISYCEFSENTSTSGGAIQAVAGTITVKRSSFSANISTGDGGALFSPITTHVSRSSFVGNTATTSGGAMGCPGASVTLTQSSFLGNTATVDGGALYTAGGTTTITNSTFVANNAVNGAGIARVGGPLTLNSVTIASNTASNMGGGISCNGGVVLNAQNSIISNNVANVNGADVYMTNGTSIGTNIRNIVESCFAENSSTCPTWYSTADPMLANSMTDNGGPVLTMALTTGSPAIDNADVSAPARDQRNYARVGVADIGALEFGATCTNALATVPLSDCDSVRLHGIWYKQTQTITETLPFEAQSGCDSVITYAITINEASTTVSQLGITLTAQENAPGTTYQWIDCTTDGPVTGATSAAFTPTQNGNYAVIVSVGGCPDTSICYAITTVGLEEHTAGSLMTLYPNPASQLVKVSLNGVFTGKLEVSNPAGQLCFERNFSATDALSFDVSSWTNGVYFVTVRTNAQVQVIRLLKK
jgi:predicted outer membrane repeat protein